MKRVENEFLKPSITLLCCCHRFRKRRRRQVTSLGTETGDPKDILPLIAISPSATVAAPDTRNLRSAHVDASCRHDSFLCPLLSISNYRHDVMESVTTLVLCHPWLPTTESGEPASSSVDISGYFLENC